MVTHAYNELYLGNARVTMATMLDYAVNVNYEDIDIFFAEFIASGLADAFGKGSPAVITGKSGIELYCDVKRVYGINVIPNQYVSINRSPVFWLGSYLAFTQWYINRSFRDITFAISLKEMISLYNPYHEMDVTKFAEMVELRVIQANNNLKMIRERNNLSQSQLASLSGVGVRNIQSFEQGKNDICKAQYEILNSLSSRLNCSEKDLTQTIDLKQRFLNQMAERDKELQKIRANLDMQKQQNNAEYEKQMKQIKEEHNRKLAEIDQKYTVKQQQLMNNYINQFPYNGVAYCNNNYYANNNVINQNFNNYWQQQAILAQRQEEVKNLLQQSLDFTSQVTNNKPTKIVADAFGILNAKNIIDFAYRVVSLIDDTKQ